MSQYINYSDYLTNTVGDKLKTVSHFNYPLTTVHNIDHDMSFRSDLDIKRIKLQADYFSRRFCACLDPTIRTGRHLSSTNVDQVRNKLEKAYIYSIYKVVYYHLLYNTQRVSHMNMLDSGLMFSGHLALLEMLGIGTINCFDQIDGVALRKSLSGIGTESCKVIQKDPFYIECTTYNFL